MQKSVFTVNLVVILGKVIKESAHKKRQHNHKEDSP